MNIKNKYLTFYDGLRGVVVVVEVVLGGKGVASISDFEINMEMIYYTEAAARQFDFFLSIPSAYHLHLGPLQDK